MGSTGFGLEIGGSETVCFAFMLAKTIYIFNATNGVWMIIPFVPGLPLHKFVFNSLICPLSNSGMQTTGQAFSQGILSLMSQNFNETTTVLEAPYLQQLQEGITLSPGGSIGAFITFPVEEIMFGREIIIDALFVATILTGVSAGPALITFSINGTPFGTLTVSNTIFDADANPAEFQIFPEASTFAAVDPQLSISISNTGSAPTTLFLRFTKIAIFGSFDPTQRPV
jgi:hypothetical protein